MDGPASGKDSANSALTDGACRRPVLGHAFIESNAELAARAFQSGRKFVRDGWFISLHPGDPPRVALGKEGELVEFHIPLDVFEDLTHAFREACAFLRDIEGSLELEPLVLIGPGGDYVRPWPQCNRPGRAGVSPASGGCSTKGNER
jgi:hypothetical protein